MLTHAVVLVNGIPRQALVRQGSIAVQQHANAAWAAAFIYNAPIDVGAQVQIGIGGATPSALIFGGLVTKVDQVYDGTPRSVAYHVTCGDYTTLLNRRWPMGTYSAVAVGLIVTDLLATFATGFTTSGVVSGLPAVSVIFDGFRPFDACLTQLVNLIGGFWYIDPSKDVHVFLTESTITPDPLTADLRSLQLDPPVRKSRDLSQIRTRVYVAGAGSALAAGGAQGATILAVQSAIGFGSAGGTALAGPQRLSYTGATLATAVIAAPLGTFTLSQSGIGGVDANTTFKYKITYNTAAGETLASAASGPITTGGTPTTITVRFAPTGAVVPGCLQSWSLYRSTVASAGAGPWKRIYANLPDPFGSLASTGFLQSVDAFGGDGAVAEPVTPTAGGDVPASSTTTSVTGAAASTIAIATIGRFLSTGGIALVTVDGTSYPLKYTGITGTYGAGTITGIPATGSGSLPVAVPSGSAIVNSPALLGLPGSGAGSISTPLPQGSPVVIEVQRDDIAAQTALAVLEGGDGIHEYHVTDPALTTIALCQARGDAELTIFKTPLVRLAYDSRDLKTAVGRSVTVSLGAPTSITGTFPIMDVAISEIDIAAHTPPRYSVTAATSLFSVTDLFRRLIRIAA